MKRTSDILRVIIQALWLKADGLPARDILDVIPVRLKLSELETSLLPATDIPLYEKIAREVTGVLVEVGWFIKNKDRWYISDDGMAACRNIKNIEEIYKAALLLCEEKRQLHADILLTVENAQEKAWQQIWRYLNEMSPVEFNHIVADLLQALNYHLDWVAPPRKKHGYIDMVAYPNPIGSSGPRVKVHVQHQGQAATVEGLRAFMGELNAHDLGIFVSSGGFTDQVLTVSRFQELRKIRLISLESLFQLWVQNYAQLSPDAKQRFPLKAVYFLAPEN
ncbi:MAG: restriction endonuclease [Chloroflexi bacterium]|nr:restriction endonuclease [Chloroflexota bacterium]